MLQTVNGAKLFTALVADEAIVAACLKRANHVFAFFGFSFLSYGRKILIKAFLVYRRLSCSA